uniref:Cyclin N-terminal domain-containing protein n=1 Tax=Anopheles epiroticus TaxID=199890 RepID=A0A182P036_9DIPT
MERWNTFFNAPYCTEYNEDILETLIECEAGRKRVQSVSPQLHLRDSVVQLILSVCEKQSYRRATVHLAIYLLDVFMSSHTIEERRIDLVGLTCLYLACKIEENEPKVPSPSRLNGFVGNTYQPADFVALEITILCFFDWHITIPTASTFLDIFAIDCFDQQDYDTMATTELTEKPSKEQLVQSINDTASKILRASLQYMKLYTIKPSLLAAACVASARCLTQGVSVWSERLANITGYDYSNLHNVCQMLLFEAMPQLPTCSVSSTPNSKRSISDAGYLSEWWETDDEDEEKRSTGADVSSASSGEDSDTTGCSESSNKDVTSQEDFVCDKAVDSSDTGERCTKKRKLAISNEEHFH